jgi:hypothetical protein|tara:strand:- start:401 stop:613 length:213 start_codon:yes stop_codon:yes gene_type:complete
MKDNNKNPLHWSEIEWKNSYALYEATNLYELDESLSFEKFKNKVLTDGNFLFLNRLRKGMDKSSYNPWKS